MGNWISRRQNSRIEEVENGSNFAYCFPPKSGNYFASHFIMGGERFEISQPEAYLFGENLDLNFLGGKPTPFPYSAPLPHEPTRTLRALINIRKESLRFVRAANSVPVETDPEKLSPLAATQDIPKKSQSKYLYNVEFTFDTDVKCAITIHYFCT